MTGPPPPSGPARGLVAVVPARDAEATIGDCLGALIAAGFDPADITVVDDGSRDATGRLAAAQGVRVLRNETAQRPARARNRGAGAAGGDAILFVDADVCVHADVRDRILAHLADAGVTGVIGAYDADPGSSTLVGRYRNLLHAYSHRQAAGEVPTFWTGLGALRRAAFEDAGGFLGDWEDIEDVELGLRVTARGGTIRLDPAIEGKHLKDWSLGRMFMTDLRGRAMPWTRLLREGRMPVGVLSTSLEKRVSAAMVALAWACLILGLAWMPALAVAAVCVAVFVAANFGLFAFLFSVGGPVLALAALPLHMLHHTAALIGYALASLGHRPRSLGQQVS
jgi:hypothetical protein